MTLTEAPTGPRRSAHTHEKAAVLAAEEYRRCADAIAALTDDDWQRPTDCSLWDVRQLVAHLIGMALMASSPLQIVKQQRAAKARRVPGAPAIDALTAHQVDLFGSQPRHELAPLMARIGAKGANGRRRMPAFVRGRELGDPQRLNGADETWTIGYLTDTILTRDPWMHRIDLSRATGVAHVLTAEHDGAIVADVVAEWAERHGRPYRLALTGPAGGQFGGGDDAEEITMDAIEFCRVLSGRAPGTGLLATEVPF
ncbi:maleylpyruvate isomerase family mycothiol-dependent enzyme [Microlunatus speluncae]|uniref:maleylpyruvate isomerase family mycothiol-dependent enzyme n=1 Tax=Microlunatus speluncae TaxID=2594267 RepID=UPI0012660C96|nr:maleylpyruvate isomerase family mycothiol-dependent enzyme [Microlunatus speluncae]